MRLLCLNFQVKVSLKANKRHGTAELQVGLLSRAQLWNKKSAPKIASKRSLLRRHPPKRLVDYQGKTGQKTPQRMWLVANDLTFMDSLSNYRRLISRKMRISCVHYHKQISSLHTWGYLDSLQVEHLVTLFRKLASDTVFLCFFFFSLALASHHLTLSIQTCRILCVLIHPLPGSSMADSCLDLVCPLG